MSSPIKSLESLIFASRWIQAPLYLGLIVAQVVYCWLFMVELSHLVHNAFDTAHITETDVMLAVLGLIDVVMIANLLIMVIVGGYETFVSRLDLDGKPLAMLVNFLTAPGSFSFKTAFDEAFSRYSPGVLIQLDNLAIK